MTDLAKVNHLHRPSISRTIAQFLSALLLFHISSTSLPQHVHSLRPFDLLDTNCQALSLDMQFPFPAFAKKSIDSIDIFWQTRNRFMTPINHCSHGIELLAHGFDIGHGPFFWINTS